MKLLRLTAFGSLCLGLFISFTSCEKEEEKKKGYLFTKSDIAMTGAQIAPVPSPSTGTGKLNVSYDKNTKILTYSMNWSGLSDSVIAIRISGPAPTGYAAIDPTFAPTTSTAALYTTTPYIVLQQFTGTTTSPIRALYPSTGSYSGTLQMDGVKGVEQNLMNGQYYVTIHTKTFTGTPPATSAFLYRWFGEIRAQITF